MECGAAELLALDRLIEVLAEENGLEVEEFEQDDEEITYGLDNGTSYVVRIARGVVFVWHSDGEVDKPVMAIAVSMITNRGGE